MAANIWVKGCLVVILVSVQLVGREKSKLGIVPAAAELHQRGVAFPEYLKVDQAGPALTDLE